MEETPAPTTTKKPVKKPSRKQNGIAIGIIVVCIIIGVAILSASPKASYQTSNINFVVVDPSTVSVSFEVQNTGKASGKPNCTANVQDASYSHTGFNSGQLSNSLAPGDSTGSALSVTVTGQGASDITSAKVSC
jgi:hypothetical protein